VVRLKRKAKIAYFLHLLLLVADVVVVILLPGILKLVVLVVVVGRYLLTQAMQERQDKAMREGMDFLLAGLVMVVEVVGGVEMEQMPHLRSLVMVVLDFSLLFPVL
jgi:hypothetical protein